MGAMADPLRPYGGENGADRVKRRRAALIEAALEILGSADGVAISVRGVCRQAGLTARYFYESFEDVDQLVGTTYDAVVFDIAEAAQTAVTSGGKSAREQIRSAVGAIVGRIDTDRRKGRVLFSQTLLSGTLATKRMDAAMMFAALTIQTSGAEFEDPTIQGAAHFYVGGLGQVLSAWIDGRIECTTDELIELCVTMMFGAVYELLPENAQRSE
jgi:AcrR family transcriptional regulator